MALQDRIYRLLLRAFPAHFRESYEDEMTRAFREMRRREGAVAAWARSVPDIALAAPVAHARALSQDLRYALRKVKHSPGTLALITITLGAGVGVNVAIYSMVDALLFRPMPVPDADTLVAIDRGAGVRETTSWLDYRDLRDRNSTLSQLTAWLSFPALVGEGGSAERRMCGLVAGNYFSTLGVRPLIGRFIEPEDDGAPGTGNIAVLSHSFWTRQYGADPGALGGTIELNNRKFTIVGVAQEDFAGTSQPMRTDLWTPLSMHPAFLPGIQETDASRDSRWLFLHGRLKHGVTAAQAESNLNAIELQIQSEHPALGDTEEKRRDRTLRVSAANGIAVPHLRRAISRGGAFMLGVTGLLVLLSAVNVAGILLARAIASDRELALRIALGGNRRRIVRELLAESVLFGMAGAVAGVAAAYASLGFINNLDMPMEGAWRWTIDARLDLRVLGYALAVSFVASLLFGLAPALRVNRADPQTALKEGSAASQGGRSGNRLRKVLAAGQFATAVTLLAATGLMVRSLNKMYDSPPGFDTAHQAYAYLILPGRVEDRPTFQKELRRRAAALPGVVSAALAESAGPVGELRTSWRSGSWARRRTSRGRDRSRRRGVLLDRGHRARSWPGVFGAGVRTVGDREPNLGPAALASGGSSGPAADRGRRSRRGGGGGRSGGQQVSPAQRSFAAVPVRADGSFAIQPRQRHRPDLGFPGVRGSRIARHRAPDGSHGRHQPLRYVLTGSQ